MWRFGYRRFGLAVGALWLALCTGDLLASQNYRKWLEQEVDWIISKAERKEFSKLETDEERDVFITRFWKRRDMTPSTERNEYREEHYRRLQFADKMFREGIPGRKTDRGRIYIIHGPPDSESYYNSRSVISPLREVPSTEKSPNTIVWSYHGNPYAKHYRGEVRLVFQPSAGMGRQTFALSDSKEAQERAEQMSRHFFPASNSNWLEADIRYKLVMAGPPAVVNAKGAELPGTGQSEFHHYVEDWFRSPGEVLEEMELEIARRERVKEELRGDAEVEVTFGSLPFDVETEAVFRESGDWLIPLEVVLPASECGDGLFDIYAALLDESGEIYDEFIDSFMVDPKSLERQGMSQFRYPNRFYAATGKYSLRTVVRETNGQKSGVQERDLHLTLSEPGKVRLSGVVLTNRVEVLPEDAGGDDALLGPADGIICDRTFRLLPSSTHRFTSGRILFLFVQLTSLQPESEVSIVATFIRDGRVAGKLEPRIVETRGAPYLDYGTAVPLTDFEPGEYILQIQAVDHSTRKFDLRRLRFEVVAAEEG